MNTKLLLRLLTLLLLSTGLGNSFTSHGQGAVNALSFNANSHVNIGDSLSRALAQSDFTIEMWIKVRSNSSDPVFLGNKNWASGSNTGIIWCRYANNTLRFNFRAAGRTRKDLNLTLDYAKWNHIAVTVKRNGNITAYVNGVQNGSPVSIASDSGYSIDAGLPFRLGADGNAAYPIDGDMDEVRIWNTVRSVADIRTDMCRKLGGAEANLMAYYRLDETGGTTITNSAATSTGFFNGTFVNTPARIASGASVGDESVQLYAASYTGQVLNLNSAANGNVQLNNINNNTTGIHLFKINAAPNTTTGISNAGTNNVYYGVFPVSDTTTYHLVYNYTNFPAANTFEGGIDLFKRYSMDSAWGLWAGTKDVVNNTLSKTAVSGRQEVIIGSFVTSLTCTAPTALNAQNITTSSAQLSWITGGSNAWNLAYGQGSFTPGTGGTVVNNLNAASYTLNNLQSNTTYTFYVRDTCASINSASAWSGPYTFSTAVDYSNYGSGYAMNFPGTAANEHVNLGDSISGAMAFKSYTLETWIRFNNPSSDPAFIGNKNWASGQNTGILWCWNGGGDLRFNFKPAGGTRRDYDINVPDPAEWNHIAMVVDRSGFLTAYLNGVQAGTPINIAADSGLSLDGVLPMRIGQDGTGVYGPKFKGAMDELRVWNKVMTAEEIRANMCHKINPADTNLMAYYRMDEPGGNILTNLAASGTVFNGALLNTPQRIISGAAIGDTSVQIYPASWNGTNLSLSSNGMGQLTIDSVEANTRGVHIYRVNSVPNITNGIAQTGTTNQHFGVYTPGNKLAQYKTTYNYSNYPNAVANNANLHLYNRKANNDTLWTQSIATNNTTTQQLQVTQPSGVKQFILADFTAPVCATPQNITAGNIDTGAATISWTSNAGKHLIEFGNAGFTLGNGTQVSSTTASALLSNLNAAQVYKFYVKDSCSAATASAWVGPFYFTTLNPCPQPFNVHADSITAASMVVKWEDNGIVTQDYIVSWGTQGFGNPAFGIQTNVVDKRYELTSATPNTVYDFYVRANCNSSVSNSGWVGPFSFTTLPCTPAQNVTVSNITNNSAQATWTSAATLWNLSYGATGFDPANGTIAANLSTAQYNFAGLSNNTVYEFYIQDSCTLGLNPWQGPFTFTTIAPSSIKTSGNGSFRLYPNPTKNTLSVTLNGLKKAKLNVYNQIGVLVLQQGLKEQTTNLDVQSLPSGVYLITISEEGKSATQKIVIQH